MRLIIILLSILSFGFLNAQNVQVKCKIALNHGDSCKLVIDKFHISEYDPLFISNMKDSFCDFKLNIENPAIANLIIAGQAKQLWLEPGDNIIADFGQDKNLGIVSFEGLGSVHNKFLHLFNKKFKTDFHQDSMKQHMLNTEIDPYENLIFNQRKDQLTFFKSYPDQDKFSIAFKNYMSNLIKYQYLYKLQAYPIIRANANTGLTVIPMPEIFLEELTPSNANQDEALGCESYRNFLTYYIIYNTSKLNGFNKFTDNSLSMESKMAFANQRIQNKSGTYSIASYLNENLRLVTPSTAKQIYNMLSQKENKGEYTKLIKPKYEKRLKAKESKSNASSQSSSTPKDVNDVKILSPNGMYFTLADLKGKVLYIDFWASWCGPCRMQFPYSKELHKRFTEKELKNIVFLYISIDKTEEIWKQAMEQNGLSDFTNGLVPGDWSSEIVKFFQINSIPRYMLVDKKGKIVDPNAKRPSDDAIYQEILRLTGQ